MATLVLGSVGGALAGPIGSAIGRAAGGQIDRRLRGTSGARRLSDLRILNSHYGAEIPAVYGRMRVAGTVIWATEPVETALVSKSGSGAGYSISLAVAISSRPVRGFGRIWADGRLIRGAGADHKIPFEVRLLDGSEDQDVDPLIASSEGPARTPAYRGLALLVFENLDLSTFGNRVPQITAEIDAGDDPFSAGELVHKVLGLGGEVAPGGEEITGFSSQGDDIAEMPDILNQTLGLSFGFGVDGWSTTGQSRQIQIPMAAIDAVPAEADWQAVRAIGADEALPTHLSLRYFDAALDFAAGEKSARIPGRRRFQQLDFPGVLGSDQAKKIVHRKLHESWSRNRTTEVTLPLGYVGIRLGDRLVLEGRSETEQCVVAKRLDASGLVLSLVEDRRVEVPLLAAEAGSRKSEDDLPPAPLQLAVIELPVGITSGTPAVGLVIAGGTRPWRPVPYTATIGGRSVSGYSTMQAGGVGVLTDTLAPGPEDLFDDQNDLMVTLATDIGLISVDDDALFAGANLACVGGELLQFGVAEPVAANGYRLRRLLRGRFGTKGGVEHAAGAAFVLVAPDRMTVIELPAEVLGSTIDVEAFAFDGSIASTSGSYEGKALRPWSPVHLSWKSNDSGLQLTWVRRGSSGLPWLDHVDAPLGATRQLYQVRLEDQAGHALQVECDEPQASIDQSLLAELGNKPWRLEVRQIGDFVLGDGVSEYIL